MKPILHVCWTQAKQTHVFLVTITKDESLDMRELIVPRKKKKITS